jgi:hypothetical protein
MLSILLPISALGAEEFSDIRETDWFFETIDALTQLGAVNGYSDGTFRPNNEITVAEYVKLIVYFIDKTIPNAQNHWATNYMTKAEELNLVDVGEYLQNTWDTPITRQQMAKISYRYMIELNGEPPGPGFSVDGIETSDYFISKIKDWNSIPEMYRNNVLETYYKGVAAGYPDGFFRGETTATRAEACAIVFRTTSETNRLQVSIDASWIKSEKPEIPKEALSLVETYMDALNVGVHEAVKYIHFEDDWTKGIYLDTNDKLLDYRIESAEMINNDLIAFTIQSRTMVSDETAQTQGEGTYLMVYNFVARIDGKWRFINGVRHIPDDLKVNFDENKYKYNDPNIVDPGDVLLPAD